MAYCYWVFICLRHCVNLPLLSNPQLIYNAWKLSILIFFSWRNWNLDSLNSDLIPEFLFLCYILLILSTPYADLSNVLPGFVEPGLPVCLFLSLLFLPPLFSFFPFFLISYLPASSLLPSLPSFTSLLHTHTFLNIQQFLRVSSWVHAFYDEGRHRRISSQRVTLE